MFKLSFVLLALGSSALAGYVQNASGKASFTHYSGCSSPACGKTATGYTAAMNQLAFGSASGLGAGDACGRCFALTGSADPYSTSYTGPFNSIVVKVTDLCPAAGNEQWCGQSQSSLTNSFGMPFHFDICEDTGGASKFFPSGHGALTGSFQEVDCSKWTGSDGNQLWNGACLDGEKAGFWPSTGCGNKGTAP
ncbi:endoglucanase V-like protein [Desarmillaria ectypa]|nr:endoglucanase V-like protein [Desarmillaria ectypa]